METKQLAKSARKEADNPTCLNSDNIEINTEKSQGNESVLVYQLKKKTFFFRVLPKIFQTDSRRSCLRE